jgi:hypothetical protein
MGGVVRVAPISATQCAAKAPSAFGHRANGPHRLAPFQPGIFWLATWLPPCSGRDRQLGPLGSAQGGTAQTGRTSAIAGGSGGIRS